MVDSNPNTAAHINLYCVSFIYLVSFTVDVLLQSQGLPDSALIYLLFIIIIIPLLGSFPKISYDKKSSAGSVVYLFQHPVPQSFKPVPVDVQNRA